MQQYIRIHINDNVAVAVTALKTGTPVALDGLFLSLMQDIPAGHKFALHDIAAGERWSNTASPSAMPRNPSLRASMFIPTTCVPT